MTLTGHLFLALVVLVAVAALVATVVVWPRLAAARPLAVVGRAGALLGTNLGVLLVVAVLMNNSFGFFADWTDLAGSLGAGSPVRSASGGGAASRVFDPGPVAGTVSAPPTALPALPAGQGAGGRLLTYTVTGQSSGVTGEVLVDLPASYRTHPHRAYPVIETFAGYPGGAGQWIGVMHLPEYVDRAVAAHRMGEAIIVSPALEIPPGVDSECVDAGVGRMVETWTTQDVPAWVHAHFRAMDDRRGWATIGLSAGGWCSAMATMLHPDQYGGSIVMGGYFKADFAGRTPWAAGSAQDRRYDLVGLARRASPAVALWLETSHADHISFTSSEALLKAARAPLSITAVVLTHAGHRLGVWEQLIPQSLVWLGRTMPGFAPSFVAQVA